MTAPRRAGAGALLPWLVLAVSACGSSGTGGVATGPSQSQGLPVTTAPPTATPSPSPSPTATPAPTPTPTPAPSLTPAPSTSPQSSPTPYVIPATDPNGAQEVGAYLYSSIAGIACGARSGHYDNCPVTDRLAQRLDSHPTTGAEPLCRCQNYWQQSTVTVTQTPDATVWIDHVVLTFGPSSTVTIDLRVLRTAGGWMGDDTTCTNHGETTSIYVPDPPPCPGS